MLEGRERPLEVVGAQRVLHRVVLQVVQERTQPSDRFRLDLEHQLAAFRQGNQLPGRSRGQARQGLNASA